MALLAVAWNFGDIVFLVVGLCSGLSIVAGGSVLRVAACWDGASGFERVVLAVLVFFFAPAAILYVLILHPFVRPAGFPLRWLMLSPFAKLPEAVIDRSSRAIRKVTFSLLPSGVSNKAISRVFWVLTAAYQLYGLVGLAVECLNYV